MKRWNAAEMLTIGQKLFTKIHQQKYMVHHNHEIHFMARELADWLPKGIESLINGNYVPRCLKRHYFPDEMLDQLHVSDRILQHLLLKELKPTFQHVMNKNCYHLQGPSGVKTATQRIRRVLEEDKPNYILRVDIKSYYKSIPHFMLLQDIKKYYLDPKVQTMLKHIITNPIETPNGYKNPDQGIALRGPLFQFFSGIYLKPLDDAFDEMDVTYLRYQDDIVIFCKTKRQLNRCRRRMMDVLQERCLSLSRKKSYIGSIKSGFHYLGIDYPPTRPADNIKVAHVEDDRTFSGSVHLALPRGGSNQPLSSQGDAIRILPHPRTLRKARENVTWMVTHGVSHRKTKNYLHRFVLWWQKTAEVWQYIELLQWFIESCRAPQPKAVAAALLHVATLRGPESSIDCRLVA